MRLKLLPILFFASAAWAKPVATPFRYQLVSRTNLGVTKIWSLERKTEGFFLSGLPISGLNVARHPKAVAILQAQGQSAALTMNCPAGRYIFTRETKAKAPYKEVGCLGSKRFAELSKSFEQIRR